MREITVRKGFDIQYLDVETMKPVKMWKVKKVLIQMEAGYEGIFDLYCRQETFSGHGFCGEWKYYYVKLTVHQIPACAYLVDIAAVPNSKIFIFEEEEE